MMNAVTVDKSELQELIKTSVNDAIIDVFTKRKDLIEETLMEVMEDLGLARAIQEAKGDELISEEDVLKALRAS